MRNSKVRSGLLAQSVVVAACCGLIATGCGGGSSSRGGGTAAPIAPAPGGLTLRLVPGSNLLAEVGTTTLPIGILAVDADWNPVEDVELGFALMADPALAGDGRLSTLTGKTNRDGLATFHLTVDSRAGANDVLVNAAGFTPLTVRIMGLPGVPVSLTAVSGDAQRGEVGLTLAQPLVVEAKDRFGNVVPDVDVDFTASGGGSVDSARGITDRAGRASVVATLGTVAGANTITASTASLPGQVTTFRLTGEPGPAARLELASGDGQSVVVGSELPLPLTVKVVDQHGNGVAGTSVDFAVSAGGGRLAAAQAVSSARGLAGVQLTTGRAAGTNSVVASATGLAGSPLTFTTTGTAGAASKLVLVAGDGQSGVVGQLLASPLVVRATDAFDNPVAGFLVAFSATRGTLSATSAPTNSAGQASTTLRLGTTAGAGANLVRAMGTGIATPLTFSAVASAGPATRIAIASGDAQSGRVTRQLAQPLVVRATDAFGNPVANVAVAFTTVAGGGTLSAASATSDASGRASVRLTLGPTVGANVVRATSGNLAGSPSTFTASAMAGPATIVSLASGDAQRGVAGDALAQPLVVLVRDAGGNLVQGFMVAFAVTSGGGALSVTTVASDAQGRAATRLTLGRTAGANTVTATAAGLTGSPVTFRATGTAGVASRMTKVSGDGQSGRVATLLPQAITVDVRDTNGNPVQGHPVQFTVEAGGTLSVAIATTNLLGRASTRWTLGPAGGPQRVAATSAGLAGSPAVFSALATAATADRVALVSGSAQTGRAGAPLARAFVVVVRDAQNNPVPGFAVAFAVSAGGGTLSATSVVSAADGTASATLTLGRAAGSNTVICTTPGLTGGPITFTATGVAGPAAKLVKVSGDGQSGRPNVELASPFVVRVVDANDNAVGGTSVAFAVASGSGRLPTATATSDAQGLASTRLTLGPNLGSNTVTVSSAGLAGSPMTFTASGMANPATQLAIVSGNGQTAVAGAALAQPFVVVVTNAQGEAVRGFMVAFAVASGGGTLSATTVATDAQGRAATTLTVGRTAGASSVTATAAGLTGSPITFTATGFAGAAARLEKVSGDAQSGGNATLLPNALVVQVNDANGNPVGGASLTFAVTAGGGSVSSATGSTDTSGRASTRLTLGAAAGANTVRVSGAGLTAVTFNATASALPPSTLAIAAGEGQSARIGRQVPGPFVVRAGDSNGAPVRGVTVGFAVTAGGGTLTVATAVTDAQGLASTVLTVGPDLGSNQVTATLTGVTPVTFVATGTPLTYALDVRPILAAKCTVCHGPGGVFQSAPLTTYVQVRNGKTLVGAQPYVVPNSTAMSVLVQKTQPGGSMADKLNDAERKLVLDWVRTGAIDGSAAQVPTSLTIVSGNLQQGQRSQPLPNPLVVIVRDAANSAVSGVTVSWAVVTGGGTLSGATSQTDALGQAMIRWTVGPAAGAGTVRASFGALTPATFTATTVASYSGAPLVGSTNPLDVAALDVLRSQNLEPAALCTDGEFLRRTTGNLVGRLPTEAELTGFLADPAGTRRALLVDRLLASTEFADFWGKQIIAPWVEVPSTVEEFDQNGVKINTFTFDAPLVNLVAADTSLKAIVTRLAKSEGQEGAAFRVRHAGNGGTNAADVLMGAFTGMTSKCARCHDHPLTQPTDDPRFVQNENYGLYAFFAASTGDATKINKSGGRFDAPVEPRFVIDGYRNERVANVTLATPLATRRARFAELFVESDAFARGTAHRIWSEIAAPLLDRNQFLKANLDAVASKPLLEALTLAFKQQSGSLKGFLRVAMGSRLYQLSSRGEDRTADRYQGRYVLRRHHGETLEKGVHSVSLANGSVAANELFGTAFGNPTRSSIESRRDEVSLEQALMQLNSPLSTAGKVVSSTLLGTLAAQVVGGQVSYDAAVTQLVRRGLSRDPTADELAAMRTARTGTTLELTRAALEDVAVVVGASPEFMFR